MKGRDTKENIRNNFGMVSPEGYRKAKRLMELASRFRLPIVTFVDTSGADPGISSEERAQAEAIAACLVTLAKVEVPVVASVIGEGGSGGALAIALADHVIMAENAVYSVASPEGCAAILWGDSARAPRGRRAFEIDRRRSSRLRHRRRDRPRADRRRASRRRGIRRHVDAGGDRRRARAVWSRSRRKPLREARYRKYRRIGAWHEDAAARAVSGA